MLKGKKNNFWLGTFEIRYIRLIETFRQSLKVSKMELKIKKYVLSCNTDGTNVV